MGRMIGVSVGTLLLGLALGGPLASRCGAEERGPSTPEERRRAVELTRFLEAEPLGTGAAEARGWLMRWWIEIPDLGVTLCEGSLGGIVEAKYEHGVNLLAQQAFSAGAYLIEHPEASASPETLDLAGVEGVLRAYEAILKVQPKAHQALLDDLLDRKAKGRLAAYVYEAAKKCRTLARKDMKLPPPQPPPEPPKMIGGLAYEATRRFKEPELGVVFTYRGDGSVLNVFVYTDGIDIIPAGTDTDVFRAQFDRAKGDIASSEQYDHATLLSEGPVAIASGQTPIPAREAVYEVTQRGERVVSYLFLVAGNNLFFKARYSVPKTDGCPSPKCTGAILADLGSLLGPWLGIK
jgi:hypothetical protein